MDIWIGNSSELDTNLVSQIEEMSPWSCLQEGKILDSDAPNIWTRFFNENFVSIMTDQKSNLISCGSFGNNGELAEAIITSTNSQVEDAMVGMFLFTHNDFQNKGHAETVKTAQKTFLKTEHTSIKSLIGGCETQEQLNLYKKYGAKEIQLDNQPNPIITQQGIDNWIFYSYLMNEICDLKG
ncbi:hypothetical protein A9Q91_03690 [Candidatus Gracilibacteria bacterium 28_42_T64]|nr:hypothetical protein A9Q91_03690 [Candidatus Gracilibacteria bacterium 28_42_T64]